jgi:DNA-binding PadR family transcriptional regulator
MAVLADGEDHFVREIARRTNLHTGTVVPILRSMFNAGLVEQSIEDVDARRVGRPQRKYSRITPDGRAWWASVKPTPTLTVEAVVKRAVEIVDIAVADYAGRVTHLPNNGVTFTRLDNVRAFLADPESWTD